MIYFFFKKHTGIRLIAHLDISPGSIHFIIKIAFLLSDKFQINISGGTVRFHIAQNLTAAGNIPGGTVDIQILQHPPVIRNLSRCTAKIYLCCFGLFDKQTASRSFPAKFPDIYSADTTASSSQFNIHFLKAEVFRNKHRNLGLSISAFVSVNGHFHFIILGIAPDHLLKIFTAAAPDNNSVRFRRLNGYICKINLKG